MNGDNKMESEMVELHMQNPQNLLTMVLCDPVYRCCFRPPFIPPDNGYEPPHRPTHRPPPSRPSYHSNKPSYNNGGNSNNRKPRLINQIIDGKKRFWNNILDAFRGRIQ